MEIGALVASMRLRRGYFDQDESPARALPTRRLDRALAQDWKFFGVEQAALGRALAFPFHTGDPNALL